MDAKTVLSKCATGLRGVLLALSILGTLVIGLTCLLFMFVALIFCDSCSGIGDWVKGAGLPLGAMGAAVAGSTLAGFALYARKRWIIGSVCLAVAPGLILVGAVSPTIRQASPPLAIAYMPFQMYHDQMHIREVERAGDSLMAQAGSLVGVPGNPLGEGWRRTETGQVAIDGLSFELCNAAVSSTSRQQITLLARCKRASGDSYTLTVEDRNPQRVK